LQGVPERGGSKGERTRRGRAVPPHSMLPQAGFSSERYVLLTPARGVRRGRASSEASPGTTRAGDEIERCVVTAEPRVPRS
jgi:hypothetical protein